MKTDLQVASMNRGMKDMANLMFKFLALGLTFHEVIDATTWKPALVVGREDLGHLGEGAVADIAVFGIDEGPVGFVDVRNRRLDDAQRVIPELTIRAGWVAWDLNGLAARPWDE